MVPAHLAAAITGVYPRYKTYLWVLRVRRTQCVSVRASHSVGRGGATAAPHTSRTRSIAMDGSRVGFLGVLALAVAVGGAGDPTDDGGRDAPSPDRADPGRDVPTSDPGDTPDVPGDTTAPVDVPSDALPDAAPADVPSDGRTGCASNAECGRSRY